MDPHRLDEGELIRRQESMCTVIMVWTKAVGRRRQTEEEIAGFCVELQCLCVCVLRGNRHKVTQKLGVA